MTFAEEEAILGELLMQTKDKIIRIESSFENKTTLREFYRNNMTDIDRYVDGLTNGCLTMDICMEADLNNNNEKNVTKDKKTADDKCHGSGPEQQQQREGCYQRQEDRRR